MFTRKQSKTIVCPFIVLSFFQPPGFDLELFDPRWIGAWWLGFVAFGFLIIIWSLVILGFPRELPGARESRLRHIEQGHLRKPNAVHTPSLKMILPDLKSLLTNWTFIFNVIGAIFTSLYLGAMVPFLPKILIAKFDLKPDQIGYAMAVMTAPFILGNVLISFACFSGKCRKRHLSGILKKLVAVKRS